MITTSIVVILTYMIACTIGGWLYFRHVEMSRPPVGVFTLSDVVIVFAFILLVPVLYVTLPDMIVMSLFVLSGLSLIYVVLEPLRHRALVWLITLSLVGADLVSGFTLGTAHPLHQAINNVFVIFSVIGISNMWAQTGMKARDISVLASALILYDFIATTQHSLMSDLFEHLQILPLAPLIRWGQAEQYAALGVGDLLMLTVFPLVMYKGFGTRAGLAALVSGWVAVIGLSVMQLAAIFPVMVVLGPMIVTQYLIWKRYSPERSLKEMRAGRARQPLHSQRDHLIKDT